MSVDWLPIDVSRPEYTYAPVFILGSTCFILGLFWLTWQLPLRRSLGAGLVSLLAGAATILVGVWLLALGVESRPAQSLPDLARRDRREFLAGTSAILGGTMAGSLIVALVGRPVWKRRSYETGYEAAEQKFDKPSTNDANVFSKTESGTVEPDSHAAIQFEATDFALLSYVLLADGHLDVLFMTKENYARYQDGEGGDFLLLHSDLDTSRAVVKEHILSGEFAVVLDNTSKGRSSTSDTAIEYELSVDVYQQQNE